MEQVQSSATRPIFQKLLTPAEAAEILGIKVDTLTIWRSTKRYPLPFVRVGRRIKYKAEDVLSFIEARTEGAVEG